MANILNKIYFSLKVMNFLKSWHNVSGLFFNSFYIFCLVKLFILLSVTRLVLTSLFSFTGYISNLIYGRCWKHFKNVPADFHFLLMFTFSWGKVNLPIKYHQLIDSINEMHKASHKCDSSKPWKLWYCLYSITQHRSN